MLEAMLDGLVAAWGGLWGTVAPYQGIFWFFTLVVLAILVCLAVAGYYLLLKDSD